MRGRRLGSPLLAALLCLATPAVAVELRGFPVSLPGKVEGSTPTPVDLDGDGRLEVAICAGDALVVIDSTGAPRPGFPYSMAVQGGDGTPLARATPAACDLDGDGGPELVVPGPDRRLHAVDAAGAAVAGWPRDLGSAAPGAATCVDLGGDGRNEIAVTTEDGRLHLLDAAGAPLRGFKPPSAPLASAPVTAVDLRPERPGVELVLGSTQGTLLAVDRRGELLDGFPVRTAFAVSGGVAAGDVDGDGRWDLVFGSQDFNVYAVDPTGAVLAGFPARTGYRLYGAPALGDLDGDGTDDVVIGGGDGKIYALRGDGSSLRGWPAEGRARIHSTPVLVDLDRDGKLEVLITSSDGTLHGLRGDGRPQPGFPIQIGGPLLGSAAVADLDGDGALEVLVAAPKGRLHAFSMVARAKAAAAEIAWAGYGGGVERIGRAAQHRAAFSALEIWPASATTRHALVAKYHYSDLDGDAERGTRIRWFLNDKRVEELDDKREVPPSLTRKGQRWRFALQEGRDHELYGDGESAHRVRSPELRVSNTPPSAPAVRFGKEVQRGGEPLSLVLEREATDADGDRVRYDVEWLRDRIPLVTLRDVRQVPAGKLKRGEQWEVIVVPSDGEASGDAVHAATTIANTPPSAPKVVLQPSAPRIADLVTLGVVAPAKDPDGDGVRYRYRWSVDGVARPLDEHLTSIPAAVARKGQVIAVEVTAQDGDQDGGVARAAVTVANTPPPAAEVSLVPARPRSDDDLVAHIAPSRADADGDAVRYAITWLADGRPVEDAADAVLPARATKRGQRIAVRVTPSDGEAQGPITQAEVLVLNGPPGAPLVGIAPAEPRTGAALKAELLRPALDADGDALRYAWSWRRDGAPVRDLAGDTVPAGRIKRGERWQVLVTASDGQASGEAGASEVAVVNTPPGTPRISLRPQRPGTRDALEVKIDGASADVDGDKLRYRFRWYRNQERAPVEPADARLAPEQTRRGDRWRVEVRAYDGEAEGPPAEAAVEIANSPPEAPTVRVAPEAPRTGQSLRCELVKPASDPDQDALAARYSWTRDDVAVAIGAGGTVAGEVVRANQRWRCRAEVSDGALRAASVASDEVVVQNTPPSSPEIVLRPERPRSDQAITCAIAKEAHDPDGDPVSYRFSWQLARRQQAPSHERAQLDAGTAKKGERWTCRAWASDGRQEGRPAQRTVAIGNAPPQAPQVRLSPLRPAPLVDALRCEVVVEAADADGDRVRHHVAWFKDGVRQNYADTTLDVPPRSVTPGSLWQCAAHASDGAESGPTAYSNSVRVGSGD